MASSFHRDENSTPLHDLHGLRPTFGSAGIISATMTNSTQELTLPTGGASPVGNTTMYRIVGTQPILFALDAAGASASYTGVTNMALIPANYVDSFKAQSTDVSCYVLQGGTAGTVQITVMK